MKVFRVLKTFIFENKMYPVNSFVTEDIVARIACSDSKHILDEISSESKELILG